MISTIGAAATGFSHFSFPFMSPWVLRFPAYERHFVCVGWALCILATLLASFATNVWHLILTQGVMYGIGWVITYVPFLIMLNEWFVERRGLAYGIVYGASGVGNLCLPLLLEYLLRRFDFRVTLRIVAILMTVITGPALLVTKPRTKKQNPKSQGSSGSMRSISAWKKEMPFLANPAFFIFCFAVLCQGTAYYIPIFYMPQYAHALGFSKSLGAMALSVFSVAQVSGQASLGYLADIVSVFVPATLSSGIASLSAFLIWGPAKSFMGLAFFSAVYGLFSGAYTVMWSRTTMYLGGDRVNATRAFGVFSFMRGTGNVLAGPISSALVGAKGDLQRDAYGLGMYAGNVRLVGILMFISSMSCFGWFLNWRVERPTDSKEKFRDDGREAQEPESLVRSRSSSLSNIGKDETSDGKNDKGEDR